ncbi:uncharacterized protein KY384_005308 [Bacidia gigantensis]|uniref:uncharacterized protein n=1 Tax=Bacidia gigantensis TaxID=2732470 RepID=UPI001D037FE9|nr:uncharacterized protein KY384_005308 [Bacidia gigantensis]KAG8529827.1 hypothetical protein KY384_005308 [Bacidia gigantensis]
MFCTPIFIHSFVVFVRLYWFERRFQNIVKEARHFRRSRSFHRTEAKNEGGPRGLEDGVRGKSIVVLHNKRALGTGERPPSSDEEKESGTASESSQQTKVQDQPAPFHRDITFADEIPKRGSDDSDPPILPRQISPEQHIAIRENQRNPKDKSALRIPGPKDFDRGREPEPLNSEDAQEGEAALQTSNSSDPLESADKLTDRRVINIDQPGNPHVRTRTNTFSRLSRPRSDHKDLSNAPTEELAPHSARLKTRTGTFSSLNKWASKENEPVAPYLSWQPTIGRNSAFVDLTEEQREELGGIEYRSLKTLAVVLLNDETINSINPSGYRVLNGLFQAASTRTAGFASVNLANLHPGIQVSYMIMMYISVFPIAISMRRTNVYEEKSLGIYTSADEDAEDEKEPSYVGAHLRKQLSFDLWYIFLGLFIIAIAEGKHLENTNEFAFTLFSVLFEIVSAYGTVGLSLGYPNVNSSFSGQFSVVSKLVIIAMEIRGRHRGLPYELDRAILLPSDRLHKKEDADASKRVHRRNSNLGAAAPPGHNLTSRGSTLARTPTSIKPQAQQTDIADSSGRDFSVADSNEHPVSSRHSGHLRRGLGKFMAGIANGH